MPNEPAPLSVPLGGDHSYLRAVREKYNAIEIWPESDRWLFHVRRWIGECIGAWTPALGLQPHSRVLNAGSGNESYNLAPGVVIDCDIADRKLVGMPFGVAGDLANLPLKTGAVDVCVCVGSVINYIADLPKAIGEIARVMQSRGKLILEFESSASLEYLMTPHFARDVSQVSTYYIYENENIWVYSEAYVRGLLNAAGFEVVAENRTHFVAPLVHRFSQNIHGAARFCGLDRWARRIPWLNRHSANVIYLCEQRRHAA